MKQDIGKCAFSDAFRDAGRAESFSYEGKNALYDWLIELEEGTGTGTEMELDVIAICCEFSEYDSAVDAAREHGYEEVVDLEPHGSVDLIEVEELEQAQALGWLQERTSVIPFDGGIIIQAF